MIIRICLYGYTYMNMHTLLCCFMHLHWNVYDLVYTEYSLGYVVVVSIHFASSADPRRRAAWRGVSPTRPVRGVFPGTEAISGLESRGSQRDSVVQTVLARRSPWVTPWDFTCMLSTLEEYEFYLVYLLFYLPGLAYVVLNIYITGERHLFSSTHSNVFIVFHLGFSVSVPSLQFRLWCRTSWSEA